MCQRSRSNIIPHNGEGRLKNSLAAITGGLISAASVWYICESMAGVAHERNLFTN
jgi:xanthine/uracil/vitamin C permease (AzgA family)